MEETIYILSNGNEVPESWLLEQADLSDLSLEELLGKNPDISVKQEEILPYGYDAEDEENLVGKEIIDPRGQRSENIWRLFRI